MKKTLAFLLSLFTAMVMIFCVPMSDSDVEADVVLTPLQRKIQEVAAETRGMTRPELNANFQASIPATNWCGYYADLVLRESFLRLGYRNYSDYYPSGEMFGSVTVSRHVDNDHRFAERYCWCEWSYNNMYGHKTSNISSYVPRIGDIITIDTSNGNGNPDPDHVAIIVRTSGSSFVTSEGNTGSKQKLDSRTVKEYSYSYNSSGFYEGPCGRVVCCLRVFDPTGSSMASSSLWNNGEFFGYISVGDGRYVGAYNDNLQIVDGNPENNPKLVFHFVPTGYEGEFVLFNEFCGLVVDICGADVKEGTNAILYKCHDGAALNQRFLIYKTAAGFILRPKHCDLVMACVSGNIQLSSLTGDSSQLFSICPLNGYVKPAPPKPTVLSASASCVGINDNVSFSWNPVPVTSKYDDRMYCVDIFNEQGEWRYTYELGPDITQINGAFTEEGIFYWRVRVINKKYKDYYSSSNVVVIESVEGEIVNADAVCAPIFPITGPEDLTLEAVATDPIGDVKIVEPLASMATVTTAATPTSTPKPTATTTPKATVATTYKATATPEPKVTATPKPEVKEFVERLYGVALSRKSDDEGMNYWVDQVKKSGMTGGDLAKNFLFSDEFICKNVSNEDFVETLYKTFFDRDSEADGKAYWVGQLKSVTMDKKTVIEGFIYSDEWSNLCASYGIASGGTSKSFVNIEPNEQVVAFATRLYTTCLGREPEADGLKYWSEELANFRVSGTNVALGFFFSDEFVGKNFSNEEYVRRLYLTFMNRECDLDGFNFWVGQLNGGATREEVFSDFSCSTEFDNICTSYGIYR